MGSVSLTLTWKLGGYCTVSVDCCCFARSRRERPDIIGDNLRRNDAAIEALLAAVCVFDRDARPSERGTSDSMGTRIEVESCVRCNPLVGLHCKPKRATEEERRNTLMMSPTLALACLGVKTCPCCDIVSHCQRQTSIVVAYRSNFYCDGCRPRRTSCCRGGCGRALAVAFSWCWFFRRRRMILSSDPAGQGSKQGESV